MESSAYLLETTCYHPALGTLHANRSVVFAAIGRRSGELSFVNRLCWFGARGYRKVHTRRRQYENSVLANGRARLASGGRRDASQIRATGFRQSRSAGRA